MYMYFSVLDELESLETETPCDIVDWEETNSLVDNAPDIDKTIMVNSCLMFAHRNHVKRCEK